MLNLNEFKEKSTKLCDTLVWALLVAPGVILNKDGSFQKTFSYRGHDLSSSTKTDTTIVSAKLNNILKRLGGGWAIFSEACRRKRAVYPEKTFPDPITRMMDFERKAYFSKGDHYESRYYVTLLYLPPEDKYSKIVSKFMEGKEKIAEKENLRVQEQLENFLVNYKRVYDLFSEVMYEVNDLTDDETLTYLHDCISTKRHPVKTPDIPMFLDGVLYDSPLVGGIRPELGNAHNKQYLAVVSILSSPDKYFPGILDELNRLNLEYRWCTRFIPLDKIDALDQLNVTRRNWFAGRQGFWSYMKSAFFRIESAMVEVFALERYNDTQAVITEVNDDVCSLGYYTNSIVLMDPDPKQLEKNVREIERIINAKGFVTKYEDFNAVGAWLGSLPGMARANIRWPFITSLELSFMFPLSAIWAGEEYNKHLDAPALMQVDTVGSTPFRLNLHYGDVGNAMIVGPIGSGKSVLLNTIEMHCRGYKNSRIYIFDKGGSCRVPTAGVGGIFYDLGSESESANSISFQPLRYIDKEDERIWASEWLQMIYIQENITLTPEDKRDIWDALSSLANMPEDERTLAGFYMMVQSEKLREAISPFVTKLSGVIDAGPYGALFGATEDKMGDNPWQAFEMGVLMEKQAAIMPTLQYLFHVIEKRCKGEPTFIFLDECWTFLSNEIFAKKIKEWFKTMRKNNVSIVFATQSLTDILNSSIADAIVESCYTRIFLPNPEALTPGAEKVYSQFHLNDTEMNIIAMATPKRQYYYKSLLGSRLFELALSPFLLSYVGSASKEDQAECIRIQKEYPKEDFNLRWLAYKKQTDALEFYRNTAENG